MKISAVSSSGRRALAVCLAAGLALSACSKEEEASKDEKSTSTTTSQADAKKSEDKDKKKAEEKKAEEKKAAEKKKAEAEKKRAEAKKAEAAKQAQQEQAKEQPKAPGGAPAQGNAANDEKEIRDLVMGMNAHVNNPHAYMNYRRDNACQRVRNEVGDGAFDEAANNLAGTGLNLIPRIDNINSVQVNGNTARVETTASAQGQSQPAPIDLVKEDGRWKFCG
ncbi:hypothetical protein [Corynebacterium sp. HMSC27B11]|uniref:Rv0361 family membrane protein n=1 Tax=Corynebacterium sp. HMSC27B11 TaxID=1581065 RepID=UPI0008A148C7|nr:hypothetical protein [Corynebacterium sp. HMSC27B11]OFS16501.1 hypothetical protein HMPREF3097_08615 [Corynebacterium sp. HMSC27B11]